MSRFQIVLVLLLVSAFVMAFSATAQQTFQEEQVLDDMISEVLSEADVDAEAMGSTRCVSVSALNVRSSASTRARVTGVLRSGQRVSCSSISNGWCRLSSGGYASARFMRECGGSSPAPAPAPSTGGGSYCTTVALNRRRSAPSGSVMSTMPRGTTVQCSSVRSGWCYLSNGGVCSARFLSRGACSAPAPRPPSGGSSGDLTSAQFRAVMPGISSRALGYLPYVNAALREGHLTTCLRKAAFLAQLGHESMSLRYMEEIASGAAYEGRRDLGNTQPGDGRRYKGRGPIQLTGRANYRAAGRALGLNLEGNPTQAATPQVGFRIAVWYWTSRSLNQYADQGTQSGFDQVTRRINGGYNGKSDRDNRWRTARRVLGC